MLVLAFALAALAPAATSRAQEPAPESPAAEAARTIVARAKALFAIGDYRAALAEFTRAYHELDGDPRQAAVLNNIAVCHERMFRYDLALEYYARYLREGAPDEQDRQEVEAVMTSLRDLLGTLRITGNVAAEVWIDDRQFGTLPLDALVPAGAHVVEVRAKAHENARREVRVSARSEQRLHFALEPLAAERGVHPAWFWSAAGIGAAALVTGGALGVAALVERDSGQDFADKGGTPDGKPARNLALGADIAFGGALLFGVTAGVLYFITDWRGSSAERDPAQVAPMTLEPRVSATVAGLVLRGALE